MAPSPIHMIEQPPYQDPTQPISIRVKDLLAHMTMEEKIGQMTQVDKRAVTPSDVTEMFLGSVLSGGGANPTPNNPKNWADMVHSFQDAALHTRLGIPLLYGVDAVHGHSNVVGATIFPHNIGLGATGDAELVEQIGRATALELTATGVNWNFAPCIAVPQDIRWGRTYEGFSENTQLVAELGDAYLTGLQDTNNFGSPGTTLACPKHFVGDGGTVWGTTPIHEWLEDNWQAADQRYKIDQGDAELDEAQLYKIHLVPYLTAIKAGARSIMVSFSSWNGAKLHGHRILLTDILKGKYGFSGFLVSDWQAIDQLSANYYECVVTAMNAGIDMVMVPMKYQRFISTLRKAVQAGDIPLARIDNAVSRILTAKFELGLFERKADGEPQVDVVGTVEHRNLAREAVRKSLVLLKNEKGILPLANDTAELIIAGAAANNIGLQCGGWTIEWQGGDGEITQGTTLLQAIRQTVTVETTVHYNESGRFSDRIMAEAGIVCLHEPPYAEGVGDKADLSLSNAQIQLIERVRTRCQRLIVIIFSGRPLIITDQLPLADAWIAAWLPGTEGHGMADVLLGDAPFVGKLPYSWPRSIDQVPFNFDQLNNFDDVPLFPIGFGLETAC